MSEVRRALLSVRAGSALCRAVLREHERHPAHALAHHLAHHSDTGSLTFEHAAGLLTEMLFATYNNVVNAVGNAVFALCNEPEQLRTFLAETVPDDSAVDELLRYGGAVQFTTRIVSRSCVIGDQQLKEHARVLLYLGSANRDETVFHEPDRLDLGRIGHKALSFGHGAHYCLGAPLARLEIGIALHVLFKAMPELRTMPGQTVQYTRPAYRGLRRLIVASGA